MTDSDYFSETCRRLSEDPLGSDEVDRRIAFQTHYTFRGWPSFIEHWERHDYSTAWIAHSGWIGNVEFWVPRYSQSIDAAATLLVPERLWSLGRMANRSGFCGLVDQTGRSFYAPTAAQALCLAALHTTVYDERAALEHALLTLKGLAT